MELDYVYRWARGKVEREGEHPRVMHKESASKMSEGIATSKVSAWVTTAGWRVCIANGTTTMRRSARVKEGEEAQKQASNGKGTAGDLAGGQKQIDKGHTGDGCSISGEGKWGGEMVEGEQ